MNLAGMQLHWFLKSKLQLRIDVDFDTILLPFSFKWNGVFCLKRRRFIHCSLKRKKEKPKTVPFWAHCGSSSSPGCARQGKKKQQPSPAFLLPFSLKDPKRRRPTTLTCLNSDSWSTTRRWKKTQRGCTPQAVLGRLHSGRLDHPTPVPWLDRGSRPFSPCMCL